MSARLSSSHWGAFRGEVSDGRLVAAHPFARDADPPALIRSIPSAVHADSRIKQPMVREAYLKRGPNDPERRRGGEPFVPVSWEVVLDLIASELARVRAAFGNQAIFGGSYGWSSAGRVNHARTLVHRFLYGFGGCVDQVTNYSWGAAAILLPHVLGDYETVAGPVSSWSGIVKHTKLMVMFGGAPLKNAQITSGGAGSHEFSSWLREARAAGVKFIVISPNKADAPDCLEAEWIPIRPNTDAALMLALAYELAVAGKADRSFLDRYTVGYDRFLAYLMGKTDGQPKDAAWAADLTEIPAETIRQLADRLTAVGRVFLTATWSLQRADHGEQPYWALIALAAMLGQIGLPGGGFGFGYGSINGMGTPRRPIATPTMEAGRNPLGIAIPVARLADLLLEPGKAIDFDGRSVTFPDIRLVYWAGGNPFHHHQDINRLLKGWARPDTIIVHDPWWTATARHADIVLPATTPFERDDLGASPRDRFILAMPRLIEPVGEARNDYDIFAALADRLGFRDAFTEGRDIPGWVRHVYEACRSRAAQGGAMLPEFDAFWRDGYAELPPPETDFVQFAAFRADPRRHSLATPSGKIELFSQRIASFGYDDCPGHPSWIPPKEWLGAPLAQRYPLHLVSNQPSSRLHSQLDDAVLSRETKIAGREPLWIHPRDAAARGIRNGDIVRVYNDRGACLAGAFITPSIRPAVIQLATGAWFDPAEPGVPGSLDKHGNPNVLTRDAGTSRLGQGCAAQSTLVEVERWEGAAPDVTAYAALRVGSTG